MKRKGEQRHGGGVSYEHPGGGGWRGFRKGVVGPKLHVRESLREKLRPEAENLLWEWPMVSAFPLCLEAHLLCFTWENDMQSCCVC